MSASSGAWGDRATSRACRATRRARAAGRAVRAVVASTTPSGAVETTPGTAAAASSLSRASSADDRLRRAVQHPDDGRLVAGGQHRQQLVADAVARQRDIGVGGVFHPDAAGRRECGPQLGTRAVEERPDDGVADGQHAAQPAGAGAPEEAQQHRLGLVVGGVGDGDDSGAAVQAHPLEERVARVARRYFERDVGGGRQLGHHRVLDDAADAQPVAQGTAEGLVAGGLGSQVMVEVGRRRQDDVAVGGQPRQHVQQRHGIRAAGQRRHHPDAGCPQSMALDVASDPPEKCSAHGVRVGVRGVPGARPVGLAEPKLTLRLERSERRLVPEGGLEPPTLRL